MDKKSKKKNSTGRKDDITKVYKIKPEKKPKKQKKPSKHPKLRLFFKIFFTTLFLLIIIGGGILAGAFFGAFGDEFTISEELLAVNYSNSVMVDINGNVITSLSGEENREVISLDEMSQYLPKAFVAIEDERFYEHSGVDIKRTLSATFKYLLSKIGIGEASYGGSTITQQVVKNITGEDERDWTRKVKEIGRAYNIEQMLSKNQILELYLNLVFLGDKAYGVQVASRYYFNKNASELDLAESAFLAGINHMPNAYIPFGADEETMENIKYRTKTVLNKMLELGDKITQEEYDAAIAKVDAGLPFEQGEISKTVFSYHTDAAIEQIITQLQEENGWDNRKVAENYLFGGGFTIYTTQNTDIQNVMEAEFMKDKYIKNSNQIEGTTSQAAMVIIDHKTGYVLGTVGGLGEKTVARGQNRATQSPRQTGSSMKPIAVLAPGLEKGTLTAGSVYDDVPVRYGTYDPKNYNYYRGLVTVRYAIETSQNIPMVKALADIGPDYSLEFLRECGISTLDFEKDSNLPLALGGVTNGITPLEMAGAYAMVANDGVYIEPTFYTKVVDSNGNTVLEPKQETKRLMSEQNAYILKSILTQPVLTGTATNCRISGMDVAAKTGTTDKDYDRWLCGFTPYYTAATWYGYDYNEVVYFSGNPSGQIWASVMKEIHANLEGKRFERPTGITTAYICRDSGLIATGACEEDPRGNQGYTEVFVSGTQPTKSCSCHQKVKICNETGKIATEYCTDFTEKVFITRTDAATNTSWRSASDAKYMLPEGTCTVHTTPPKEEPKEPEEPEKKPDKDPEKDPDKKPDESEDPDEDENKNNTNSSNNNSDTNKNNNTNDVNNTDGASTNEAYTNTQR